MKKLKPIIITILSLYFIFGILLYINQNKFLYHPKTNIKHKYKNIFIKNNKEKIQIIGINTDKNKAILYFGGNAENVSKSTDYIKKQFPNYAIYLMVYRGFGLSSGKPSEKGIFSDALALYDYVHKQHKNISIGGRSLGSGIAAYVASKRDVKKLALITPFNSIENIAQDKYPIYPISILLNDKYNTEDKVKDINAKTLIITAEKDKLVLKKYSDKLIKKFKELKKDLKIIEIKGRGHGDISSDKKYFKDMQEFIK